MLVPKWRQSCIFATNRKLSQPLRLGDRIDLESFSKTEDGDLVLGKMELWVYDPRTILRRPGVGKRLWRKVRFPFRALPIEHVEYSDMVVTSASEIHSEAKKNQGDLPRSAFNIFVHGYGTSIDSAVDTYGRFIHKVRYDQMPATPILYSWSSLGKATRYGSDTQAARRAEVPLTDLFNLLSTKKAPPPAVDIIAHSHGASLTLESLIKPSANSTPNSYSAAIKNLVFVAPDIDSVYFNQRFANAKEKVQFFTIYFSRADIALMFSGWAQSVRLGQQPTIPSATIDDIDFIDASSLDPELLGHSYHVGCAEMHEDIRGLLEGNPAQKRRLLRPQKIDARMWTLLPDRN